MHYRTQIIISITVYTPIQACCPHR